MENKCDLCGRVGYTKTRPMLRWSDDDEPKVVKTYVDICGYCLKEREDASLS